MKRNALHLLTSWLVKKHRKPLVLRGARQVGKSTLVRLFAGQNEADLIEINLEVHRELDTVFARLDMDKILLSIQSISNKKITKKSLIFLDEIQATPNGIAALRYFYEKKPEIPVIAAGSLLEFTLSKHKFSMPVGRIEYLYLGPMSFMEYLSEIDPVNSEILNDFNFNKPLPPVVHNTLLQRQREYMLVGGMPEAVSVYSETKSFEEVFSVQNSICNTYIDDFSKYAWEKELINLQYIFRSIPKVIGNKLKYSNLLPDEKSTTTKKLLNLLIKAQVVREAKLTDASGIPLAAGVNEKFKKLFFLDIGLVARLLQIDRIDLENLNNRQLINEGPFAEQFISQHLNPDDTCQTNPELYYWANESKKSNAEIDFVISRGRLIVPLEIKAGKAGSLKSLHHFMQKKKLAYAIRFDINLPSKQEVSTTISLGTRLIKSEYCLLSLPLYAVEKLTKILDNLRRSENRPG
ncbi:MAG: ATP-binding protein [Spirochaetales bacterium]|nr:ATP-binding protein [Spirochaetales bacterium]